MLNGSSNVLARRVAKIEAFHQVFGLIGFKRDLSAIEVGDNRAIAGLREAVRNAFDLVV